MSNTDSWALHLLILEMGTALLLPMCLASADGFARPGTLRHT